MTEEKISELCKALGDPNRLKIIKLLTDGEQCACKLLEACQITQPTLSHHMKVLEDNGLVIVDKKANWHYYSLNRAAVDFLISNLTEALSVTKDCICNDKNKKC